MDFRPYFFFDKLGLFPVTFCMSNLPTRSTPGTLHATPTTAPVVAPTAPAAIDPTVLVALHPAPTTAPVPLYATPPTVFTALTPMPAVPDTTV